MAVPVEGEPFPAQFRAVDVTWQLTFAAADSQRTVSATDLVVWGRCKEQDRGATVLLADGGLVAAEAITADKENLTVRSECFGTQKLPFGSLSSVVFRPPSDRRRRDALFGRVLGDNVASDRLLLDNGDELTGSLVGIENDTVTFDADVGTINIATDRIIAVVFNPERRTLSSEGNNLRTWIGFSDGSRLLATEMVSHDASLRITADGQTWNSSVERLVFLQPLGGRAIYLSDLKPAEYRQVPYLDSTWPYQSDRNVTGGWLRCGGRLYLKGLGVHSKSQLVYQLPPLPQMGGGQKTDSPRPQAGEGLGVRAAGSGVSSQRSGVKASGTQAAPTRFWTEIGIDDSTGGKGSVRFQVLVDGQEKFTSPIIRGGDAPVPVSVDLTGAKKLELLVDYADGADVLDHADWLNARLVRD